MTDARDRRLTLAIAAAALAGAIDAVALLALGGLYAGAMAADGVRLAAGIAARPADAWLAAGLIAGFVAGVVAALLVARRAGAERNAAILALAGAAVLAGALLAPFGQGWPFLLPALAAGAIHALPDRDDALPAGGLLIRLGTTLADWIARDGPARAMLRPALIGAGFLGGALAGVGLYWRMGTATLWIVGAVCAGLALWLWRRDRSQQVKDSPSTGSGRSE